ncbi:MAG: DUF2834 domain-containing protein [Pseudomonadota bacterium]
MSAKQKLLCLVYALIALLALVGTWGHAFSYLPLGVVQANVQFWQDTLVNPASRFIGVDIIMLCMAVWLWMLTEARRLGVRGVWWYVAGSVLIGVSTFVPLFLIHREVVRARWDEGREGAGLTTGDWAGMALVLVVALGYTGLSFGVLPGL